MSSNMTAADTYGASVADAQAQLARDYPDFAATPGLVFTLWDSYDNLYAQHVFGNPALAGKGINVYHVRAPARGATATALDVPPGPGDALLAQILRRLQVIEQKLGITS